MDAPYHTILKMYKYKKATETSIEVNNSTEGEWIEQKIERVVNNGEPIEDGAPIIYTERKEGVIPAYNIRTDTREIAVEAMDLAQKQKIARREAGIAQREGKIITHPSTESGQQTGESGA